MPVGLFSVLFIADLLAVIHVQLASSMLQDCILASVSSGARVDDSGEQIAWEDLACMFGVCMLETICRGSPDCGNPRHADWLAHRNAGSTLLNHFTTDHLASARGGTPL